MYFNENIKFRYMKYLTEHQIEKFQNDGFLLIKKFFSKDEMKIINEKILKFSKMKPNDWESGKEMAYYETSNNNDNERILSRVEKYVDYHPEFQKLANSKNILYALEDLMGGSCVLFKDKINFKRTGGGGFRPHQDVQARWDEFVKYTMNVMISTDQSTPKNGCLEVAAGHHKHGLIGNYDRPLEGNDLNGMEFEMVPTEVGDVLFFDHFTPHQSKPNMSDKPRSNIYLTYNLFSEGEYRNKYLDKKRHDFPPDNERTENMEIKNSAIHEAKYKEN
ncbi:MAG: phytanoyl-CoA dioxygenase [Thaumarchaeota archaeon]|nr:MAG: phytanoyl-CoA dioxygenase [Nitrososphaerota archaeon]